MLDTEVFGDHPGLTNRVRDFIVVDPIGRVIRTDGNTFDGDRHGTHVCDTICGTSEEHKVAIGVAPGATLAVAGVLLGRATLVSLLSGINWAIEKGARIMNMSLGLPYYEPQFAPLFKRLIDVYDILPVAAIGNENHGNSSSPGNAPDVLAVGAAELGYRGRLQVPFFSSGASLVFSGTSHIHKPDLVAPGVRICSSIPPEDRAEGHFSYAYMNGTSMAAPHVSGAAALLMEAFPKASTRQLGCVVVRGNRACIEALASLPEVESIMENHEMKRLAFEPSVMFPK